MVARFDDEVARWGTPEEPVHLSTRATDYLNEVVGKATPTPAIPRRSIEVGPSTLSADAWARLSAEFGANASRDDDDRLAHSGGFSYLDLLARRGDQIDMPDAVIHPESADQVGRLLAICVEQDLAVIPFGGGTSVVGGLRPDRGHHAGVISLSLDLMAELIDVDDFNMTVTVGPGMTGPTLERLLQSRGLTLGHFPQSWERASIGGYVATRSAGQGSAGYGRSDDMVESLSVVTPTGSFVLGKAPGTAAGPDLRQLFVGSEGAFGVITEVTMRIRRLPALKRYEGVMFADYNAGLEAFRELMARRAGADMMRLSDPEESRTNLTMALEGTKAKAFNAYLKARRVSGGSMAIFGWEGTKTQVGARRNETWRVLHAHGGVSLGEQVGKSWEHSRFNGPYLRDALLDAGYLIETLETATHWRDLGALRDTVATALRKELSDGGPGPLVMSHLSHVYETGGSLYVTVAARRDHNDPIGQWSHAKAAAMDAIVGAGATITHHHAVGRDHQPWMNDEVGASGVALLREVKSYLDPNGIMNPGALVGLTE